MLLKQVWTATCYILFSLALKKNIYFYVAEDLKGEGNSAW